MKTEEQLKEKYLSNAGYYVRETYILLLDFIQANNLPYTIKIDFNIKHENWKYVEKVHLR